jgi:hypothetical protein
VAGGVVAARESGIQGARARVAKDLVNASEGDLRAALKATAPARGQAGFNALTQKITAELARRAAGGPAGAAAAADATVQGGFTLSGDLLKPVGGGKPKKGPATPRDLSDEQSAQIAAQIAAAERDVLRARLDLADSADERAALEKEIVQKEAAQEDARLRGRIAAINDKKNKGLSDAKKAELTAQLESLRLKNQEVASLQAQAVDRERADRQARDAHELKAQGLDLESELLSLQGGLAETARQRRAIEVKLLDLAEQRAQADLDVIAATRGVASAEYQRAQAALDGLRSTRGVREEAISQNTAGPAEQFIRDNSPAKAAERFEAITVGAFDNLADGLANAIVHADSLGDVAKNVFRQMVADLLAASIKKSAVSILTAVGIPGFASGTSYAPGGLALVGERGPELVKLPRGSQVTPTSETMKALQNMQMPRGVSSTTVVQHYDLRGAVVQEDLYAQMQAIGRQSAVQGAQAGRALAAQDSRRASYNSQLNQ